MAQQVKFHSVDAASYAGITTPDNGSLYFISDNGEIRKGNQHITGSRVFTATDSTGKTPVKDLDIKIDAKSINTQVQKKDGDGNLLYKDASGNETTSATHTEGEGEDAQEVANEKVMVSAPDTTVEQPKRGDMLVVTAGDKISSYVYHLNGGTYTHEGWMACTGGNFDASNVVITEGYKVTQKVGEYEVGTDIEQGTTLADVIQAMLCKPAEPEWKRNPPTASMSSPSAGSVEYGTTVEVTFTASFNDAYAQYTNGSEQYAGCEVDTSANKGYHIDDAVNGSSTDTVKKSWVAGVETAPKATVTIDYTDGNNVIKNNQQKPSTTISPQTIEKGTTTKATGSASVTAYRNWFYGVDTDGTGTIDSALIRTLTMGGNCKTAKKVEFTTGAGAKRIIVAIPKSTAVSGAKTLKEVILVSASNTPIYTKNTAYFKQDSSVTVEGANGATGVAYDVWVYQPASISPSEIHNIEIG